MKKIFNIVLAGVAVMMSASCEKSFELQRPNQEPWQSVEEFNLAIQSSYLYFTERPWTNAMGMMALSGFGESDIAWCLPGMSGDSYYYAYDQRTFKNLTLGSAKELEGAFMYLYDMSTTTNAALKFIADAENAKEDPFTGMSDKDRTQMKEYKGELLFQRALTYWYIARKWAPPYNETNKDGKYFVMYRTYENNPDSLKNAKLASVQEVYDAICEDLDSAITLLPVNYPSDPGSARMRVNKYAAKALKARILFYMGAENNKAQIKTLLDEVIDAKDGDGNILYELSEDPYAAFSKMGTGYGKETIWQICYSSSTERFDRNPGIFNYYAYNTGLYSKDDDPCYKEGFPKYSGYCAFVMSFSALMQIGWEKLALTPAGTPTFKVTEAAKKDKRFRQLYMQCIDTCSVYYKGVEKYGSPDLVFLWKYFRGSSQTAKAERRANRPLIRLADMILMRAQINYMLGNTSAALTDVNMIRTRAGLDDLTSVTETDIENERIKEMAGENADRMNWLVGLHKDIPVGNRNLLYELQGKEGPYKPIQYPYSDMFYQVPVVEWQSNAAYKDNPLYY